MFSWLPKDSKLSFLDKCNARLVAHSCQSVSIPIPCCHCSPSAGTVTNTCPVRRTSTGRHGLHGNAATCPAAEVSSLGAEPARTATTVPGVVRYVAQTIALAGSVSVRWLLIVREPSSKYLTRPAVSGDGIGIISRHQIPLAVFLEWRHPSQLLLGRI